MEIEDITSEDYIEQVQFDNPDFIPPVYFIKKNNKTSKLILDQNERVKLANREYKFGLTDPVYITTIEIPVTGVSIFTKMSISYFDCIKQETVTKKMLRVNQDSPYKVYINTLADKFIFKPDLTFTKDKYVDSVNVYGFYGSTFTKSLEIFSDTEDFKDSLLFNLQEVEDSVLKLENKKEELITEEKAQELRILQLSKDIDSEVERKSKAISERTEVEISLKTTKSSESDLLRRTDNLNDNINRRETKLSQLNSDIAKSESDLKSLESDIDLFPTELSGFVDQTKASIKSYLKYAAIPAVLLIVVTGTLFWNAVDLTTLYKREENINILTVFLTRLPYLLIALALIRASYGLAKYFIEEIVKINQQRLGLFKISIIATDISKAAEHGIDISDQELLSKRHEFKMELLREHMKNYFEPEYKYIDTSSKKVPKTKKESKTDNSEENTTEQGRL